MKQLFFEEVFMLSSAAPVVHDFDEVVRQFSEGGKHAVTLNLQGIDLSEVTVDDASGTPSLASLVLAVMLNKNLRSLNLSRTGLDKLIYGSETIGLQSGDYIVLMLSIEDRPLEILDISHNNLGAVGYGSDERPSVLDQFFYLVIPIQCLNRFNYPFEPRY